MGLDTNRKHNLHMASYLIITLPHAQEHTLSHQGSQNATALQEFSKTLQAKRKAALCMLSPLMWPVHVITFHFSDSELQGLGKPP